MNGGRDERERERGTAEGDSVSLAYNCGTKGAPERRSRSVEAGKYRWGVVRVHERSLNDERGIENESKLAPIQRREKGGGRRWEFGREGFVLK